jgi:hypothetical protein
MKVDDTYYFLLHRANLASFGNAALDQAKYAGFTQQYVDFWVNNLADQIRKINLSGGVALLNMPEA